jgi:hypothetical protein
VVSELAKVELLEVLLDVESISLKTALGESLGEVGGTTLETSVDLSTSSVIHTLITASCILSEPRTWTATDYLIYSSLADIIPKVLSGEWKKDLLFILVLRVTLRGPSDEGEPREGTHKHHLLSLMEADRTLVSRGRIEGHQIERRGHDHGVRSHQSGKRRRKSSLRILIEQEMFEHLI